MKTSMTITFLLLMTVVGIFTGCSETADPKEYFYVGTFDLRGSEGLYVFELDREEMKLTQLQTVSDRGGPNFQAIHPSGRFLYSISGDAFSEDADHGTISAYRIDRETGMLTLINEQSIGDSGPAHVSVDPQGRFAYVSNYGPGSVSVLGINDDGSLTELLDLVQHEGSGADPRRQSGPHAHSVIPSADGRFIYASDLGIDKIMIYEVDGSTGKLSPAETPFAENAPGSGPRHFVIHPDGEFAWSIEEMTFTVAGFSVDPATGALEQIQRLDLAPDNIDTSTSSGADIHISPDGKFLYGSVRGADLLTIYEIDTESGMLNLVGHEPVRGGHPRNFGIDKFGAFVFVANRDSDHVVFFSRDESTGELTFTGLEASVPGAVCVTQLVVE